MKVRILKGTNQIGGCITEITSSTGTKIIIDYGENLDGSEQVNIEGLTDTENETIGYDAVFITHSHGDHIGNVNRIKNGIPIYMEEKSDKIHDALCDFQRKFNNKIRSYANPNIKHFKFKEKKPIETISIKDITLTPYIVDHSSYNSAMFLVEVDGKKILHTGDYRNHGKKGIIFEKTLKEIGKVDLLITEGTTLTRSKNKFRSEKILEKDFNEVIKNYDQVYFMCSSTNIDRITTIYKASKGTHIFIEDLCMNSVTQLLDNIPTSNSFPLVYTYISRKYRDKYEKGDKCITNHINRSENKIYDIPFNKKFVMSVKTSMREDIEKVKEKIKNACLIYSMWGGYKSKDWEDPTTREFIEYMQSLNIDLKEIHTSGHADRSAMEILDKILEPENVIVIHTEDKEESLKIAREIFGDSLLDIEDNQYIVI